MDAVFEQKPYYDVCRKYRLAAQEVPRRHIPIERDNSTPLVSHFFITLPSIPRASLSEPLEPSQRCQRTRA